ncbi:MAG: pyrimidine utilization protein, partial [Sphingomonas bacterium]|uniref:alpha/beta fold hydrolase n=1 Tax=Sphingomonas bacterium TaxID=1895847 RepID=UPI002A543093|nr:pyrimidine utilization protein [Sphingomonas bacterium]
VDTTRFEIIDELGALVVPALFLATADDALVPPACSDALHAAAPRSAVARLAYGGHACNVTDPDSFNRVALDFLGA